MKKFKVFIFDKATLIHEEFVAAENTFKAREQFIVRGYPSHCIYILDITK